MSFTKEQIKTAYKSLPEKIKEIVTSPEISELILLTMKQAGLSEENAVQAEGEIFSSMLGLQTMNSAIDNISKVTNISVEKLSEAKNRINQEISNAYEEAGIKMGDAEQTKQEILQDLLPHSGDTKEQIIKELQTRRLNAGNEPVIATKETEETALKEFSERPVTAAGLPEVASQNLPMVEEGEVAHEVPHTEPTTDNTQPTTVENKTPAVENKVPAVETKPIAQVAPGIQKPSEEARPKFVAPVPDYRYPGGNDPYREPLA